MRPWTQRQAAAACQGRPDPPSHGSDASRIPNARRRSRPPAGTPVIRSCGAFCRRRRTGRASGRNRRPPTSKRLRRSRTPKRQQRPPETNRRARGPPFDFEATMPNLRILFLTQIKRWIGDLRIARIPARRSRRRATAICRIPWLCRIPAQARDHRIRSEGGARRALSQPG